jgi:hypothetical protein
MRCEHCGSPIDAADSEKGTCTHCGVVLPHVLRAAEKAEIIRRVVAEGGTVRVEGDRIEAEGARRELPPARASGRVWAVLGAVIAGVVGVVVARSALRAPPPPVMPLATTPAVPPAPVAPTPPPPPDAPGPLPTLPASAKPATSAKAGVWSVLTVERIVATHKGQYERCQREELARNPSAPRRYSVAITVDARGRAEWVEVLSEASGAMKTCIEGVTKALNLPRPASGSARSLVTLSLGGP